MHKKIRIQFLLTVLIFLFAISPAWGGGYIHHEYVWELPFDSSADTYSTRETIISCYNSLNGELLNCPFEQEITMVTPYEGNSDEAIKNNGGHTHDYTTRPLYWPADGEGLEFDYDTSSDPKMVVGRTNDNGYKIALILHHMPEIGGRMLSETRVFVPDPLHWVCSRGCYSNTETRYQTIIDVAIYENTFINYWWYGFSFLYLSPLTELPDPGEDDHYVKTGQKTTHPRNHYGTTDTIAKLEDIAKRYFMETGRTLQINDISLPKGGLFDINANWKPSHITHRTGTDADIDVDKKWCVEDSKLRDLVDGLAEEGENRPHLLCENENHEPVDDNDKTGKYKHIDFD